MYSDFNVLEKKESSSLIQVKCAFIKSFNIENEKDIDEFKEINKKIR